MGASLTYIPHLFTPAEADQHFPRVKRIAADIVSKTRELRRLAPDQHKQEVGDRLWAIELDLIDHMRELEQIAWNSGSR
jgi:hypothetical protein